MKHKAIILLSLIPLAILLLLGAQIENQTSVEIQGDVTSDEIILTEEERLDLMIKRFNSDNEEDRNRAIVELQEAAKEFDPVHAALIESLLKTVEENNMKSAPAGEDL